MAVILLIVLQVLCPLRWDHLLAMIPQFLSMFMLFCILTNLLSIYAPLHVAAGSLKPTNAKLATALLHMLGFMVFFPISQAMTLLPWGAELHLTFWVVVRASRFACCYPCSNARSSPSSTTSRSTG